MDGACNLPAKLAGTRAGGQPDRARRPECFRWGLRPTQALFSQQPCELGLHRRLQARSLGAGDGQAFQYQLFNVEVDVHGSAGSGFFGAGGGIKATASVQRNSASVIGRPRFRNSARAAWRISAMVTLEPARAARKEAFRATF